MSDFSITPTTAQEVANLAMATYAGLNLFAGLLGQLDTMTPEEVSGHEHDRAPGPLL